MRQTKLLAIWFGQERNLTKGLKEAPLGLLAVMVVKRARGAFLFPLNLTLQRRCVFRWLEQVRQADAFSKAPAPGYGG